MKAKREAPDPAKIKNLVLGINYGMDVPAQIPASELITAMRQLHPAFHTYFCNLKKEIRND